MFGLALLPEWPTKALRTPLGACVPAVFLVIFTKINYVYDVWPRPCPPLLSVAIRLTQRGSFHITMACHYGNSRKCKIIVGAENSDEELGRKKLAERQALGRNKNSQLCIMDAQQPLCEESLETLDVISTSSCSQALFLIYWLSHRKKTILAEFHWKKGLPLKLVTHSILLVSSIYV